MRSPKPTAASPRAAVKLRRQGIATSQPSVFLQTNPFRKRGARYMPTRGVTLPVVTADTAKQIAAAQATLGAIWRDGYCDKKAGVMLINLVKAATIGDGLFERRDDCRSLARVRTLDGLNTRFGRDSVTLGRTGARRTWGLRSEMLSRRFTTD